MVLYASVENRYEIRNDFDSWGLGSMAIVRGTTSAIVHAADDLNGVVVD